MKSRYQTARKWLIFWTLFIGIGAIMVHQDIIRLMNFPLRRHAECAHGRSQAEHPDERTNGDMFISAQIDGNRGNGHGTAMHALTPEPPGAWDFHRHGDMLPAGRQNPPAVQTPRPRSP